MISFQTEQYLDDRLRKRRFWRRLLEGWAFWLFQLSERTLGLWVMGVGVVGSVFVGMIGALKRRGMGCGYSLGLFIFWTAQLPPKSCGLFGGWVGLFSPWVGVFSDPILMPFETYIMMFVLQTPVYKLKQGSTILCYHLFGSDDYCFAEAQYQSVEWVNSQKITGAIAGHWGQHYEKSGWISAEDDVGFTERVEYLLRSSVAWPQEPILACVNESIQSLSGLVCFSTACPPAGHARQYHASAI